MSILVFIFGSIIGSFLNVLILRLPNGKSIGGRSHCMHCKHELAWLDLVPIFSYLFLRGRCRYCGKRISPRYIIVETITGLLFVTAYLIFMPAAASAASWIELIRAIFIVVVLILIFAIDLEHFLILDKVIFPAGLALLILNFMLDVFKGSTTFNSFTVQGILSAAGLALFFGAIYFFSDGRWIGFGDVKFSLFLGLATPFPFILVNIFGAFFLGSVIGIILLASGIKKLKSEIPFGTFLALSTAATLFFGPQIIDWYLRLISLSYLAHY